MKELRIYRDFESNEKSIRNTLEKAETDTWIEISNILSYRKLSNGRWKRVRTDTGASMGTATASNYDLANTIWKLKRR